MENLPEGWNSTVVEDPASIEFSDCIDTELSLIKDTAVNLHSFIDQKTEKHIQIVRKRLKNSNLKYLSCIPDCFERESLKKIQSFERLGMFRWYMSCQLIVQ